MRLVELSEVTEQQWRELMGTEQSPWGGVAEELAWRDKQRLVGIRSRDGRLAAVAGAVLADVEVGGARGFQVLGIGSVFVRRDERGQGLVARLVEPLLAQAGDSSATQARGPQRAMLFCRLQLIGMYRKLAFQEIEAPVSADQPAGRIEMPLRAMWRPLREGTSWPPGPVELGGLPF